MFPAKFAYAAPTSLQEAVGLLEDPEAKILAGGHSLLPLMKLRLAQPKLLVDIGRIPGLSYIRSEDGQLAIEDLNSANGTYVNRGRIFPGQKQSLKVNDIVQIGNVQLKVVV